MSCVDIAACLTILGLTLELGALWAVGRKFMPSRRKPEQVSAAVTLRTGGRATARGTVTAQTDSEESKPPETFEELRARVDSQMSQIRTIQASIEGKIDQQTEQVREELAKRVEATTLQAIRGDQEIRELIGEQAREALGEQKREVQFFALGVAIQVVAAVLILAC